MQQRKCEEQRAIGVESSGDDARSLSSSLSIALTPEDDEEERHCDLHKVLATTSHKS